MGSEKTVLMKCVRSAAFWAARLAVISFLVIWAVGIRWSWRGVPGIGEASRPAFLTVALVAIAASATRFAHQRKGAWIIVLGAGFALGPVSLPVVVAVSGWDFVKYIAVVSAGVLTGAVLTEWFERRRSGVAL